MTCICFKIAQNSWVHSRNSSTREGSHLLFQGDYHQLPSNFNGDMVPIIGCVSELRKTRWFTNDLDTMPLFTKKLDFQVYRENPHTNISIYRYQGVSMFFLLQVGISQPDLMKWYGKTVETMIKPGHGKLGYGLQCLWLTTWYLKGEAKEYTHPLHDIAWHYMIFHRITLHSHIQYGTTCISY